MLSNFSCAKGVGASKIFAPGKTLTFASGTHDEDKITKENEIKGSGISFWLQVGDEFFEQDYTIIPRPMTEVEKKQQEDEEVRHSEERIEELRMR